MLKNYTFLLNFSKRKENLPYRFMQGTTDVQINIKPLSDGKPISLVDTVSCKALYVFKNSDGTKSVVESPLEWEPWEGGIIKWKFDEYATAQAGTMNATITLIMSDGVSHSSNVLYEVTKNEAIEGTDIAGNIPTIGDIQDQLDLLEFKKANRNLDNVRDSVFFDKAIQSGIKEGIEEAPANGVPFVRAGQKWRRLDEMQEVPWERVYNKPENFVYTVNEKSGNVNLTFRDVGSPPEAPSDNKAYVRYNGRWEEIDDHNVSSGVVTIVLKGHGFIDGQVVGHVVTPEAHTVFALADISDYKVEVGKYILGTGLVKVIGPDSFKLFISGYIDTDTLILYDEDNNPIQKGVYYLSKTNPGKMTPTRPNQFEGGVIQSILEATTDEDGKTRYNLTCNQPAFMAVKDVSQGRGGDLVANRVNQPGHGFATGDFVGLNDNLVYELCDLSNVNGYILAEGIVIKEDDNSFLIVRDGIVSKDLIPNLRDDGGQELSVGRYFISQTTPGKVGASFPSATKVSQTAVDVMVSNGDIVYSILTQNDAYITEKTQSKTLIIDQQNDYPRNTVLPFYLKEKKFELASRTTGCDYIGVAINNLQIMLFMDDGVDLFIGQFEELTPYYLSDVAGEFTTTPQTPLDTKCFIVINNAIDIKV